MSNILFIKTDIKNNYEQKNFLPGTYDPFNKNNKIYPDYNLKSNKRINDKKKDFLIRDNKFPGPGSYNINKNIFNNKFGIFNKSKKLNNSKNSNPGPGSYNIKNLDLSNKGITITSKKNIKIENNEIGPGNYHKDNIDIIKKNNPKYKFNKEEKFKSNNNIDYPAPNKYQNTKFLNKGPKWKFGSDYKREDINLNFLNPGPGKYQPQYYIGKGLSYTMSSKLNNNNINVEEKVGPGKYDLNFKYIEKKTPEWKLGKEKRQKVIKFLKVGPGSYETNIDNKNKLLGKFGKNERNNHFIENNNPGPGKYDLRKFEYKTSLNSGFLLTSNNKRKNNNDNENPGPGNYSPDVEFIKNKPSSYKIKENYYNKNYDKIKTPGPGTYEINKSKNEAKFVFTSENRFKTNIGENPGPGKYNHKTFIGTGKKFSIRQKLINNNNLDISFPGPSNYKLNYESIKKNSSKMSFKIDKRFKENNNNNNFNVGPGKYNTIKKNNSFKGGSIGKSERSISTYNKNPGPGNYKIKSIFEENKEKIKGFTMNSKIFNTSENNYLPGPGNYIGNYDRIRPKTPNCKIGKEKRNLNPWKFLESNPGPGDYSFDSKLNKKSIVFNKTTRFDTKIIEDNIEFYVQNKKTGPSYSFRKKINDNKKEDIPGPGKYKYDYNKVLKNNTGVKFNNDPKLKMGNTRMEPGPGSYNYEKKNLGIKYSFGKDLKTKTIKDNNPGPGNYNIKSSFD